MKNSIASATACMDCSSLLLTDQSTAVPEAIFARITRIAMDSAQLVHSRLKAIQSFLMEEAGEDNIVLLDPDALVERDFSAVFQADFDVGLTYRSDFADSPMEHEPFNMGVVFIRGDRRDRARSFFDLCLRHFAEVESWGPVGWIPFMQHVLSGSTDRLEIGGCTVAFFPSDLYNNSGPESAGRPYIRHFKGIQKAERLGKPAQ